MLTAKRGTKVIGIYDKENKVLYKNGLSNKHLLWSIGGVPAIDAEMYDAIKPLKEIICKTKDGKKFIIKGEDFEHNKQEISYGYGKQYTCPLENWIVN